jgi:hypothetical protein
MGEATRAVVEMLCMPTWSAEELINGGSSTKPFEFGE